MGPLGRLITGVWDPLDWAKRPSKQIYNLMAAITAAIVSASARPQSSIVQVKGSIFTIKFVTPVSAICGTGNTVRLGT